MLFCPPGNRALFFTFWVDFLTKSHRRPGEKGKSIYWRSLKNPVETAPRNCGFLSLVDFTLLGGIWCTTISSPMRRPHIRRNWEEPSMDQCQCRGKTLEKLSGPLAHTNFPRKRYGPMIGPYQFPPKLVWTNGTQSSLKVSVLTSIGPQSALPCVMGLL